MHGISGTALSKIKAVLTDNAGNTAVVILSLSGTAGSPQTFSIASGDIVTDVGSSFAKDHIASITFLVDKTIATGSTVVTGILTIGSSNLPTSNIPAGFVVQVPVDSTTASPTPGLGYGAPAIFASAAGAITNFSSMANGVQFSYNALGVTATPSYDYAGAALQFTGTYNLGSSLILGVKSASSKIKVMAKDSAGRIAIVEFTGVTARGIRSRSQRPLLTVRPVEMVLMPPL